MILCYTTYFFRTKFSSLFWENKCLHIFFGRFLSYFPRTKLRWLERKNVWKMMSANLQQHLTLVFRIDFMATGIFLKEEFSRKRKHNRVKIYLNKHCYFIHFVFHEIFMLYFQDLRMFHRNLVERLWTESNKKRVENWLLQ